MEELVNRFTPIVYMHPEEQFFPVSINWLLQRSELIDYNVSPNGIKSPTNRDLYNIAQKYNFQTVKEGDIILSYNEYVYKGQIPMSEVPIYALYREKDGKKYITYIILFAYNGTYNIAGIAEVGDHPGDMEHLTVELNTDNTLSRVFYSAHGVKDGRWVDAKDVLFENDKIVAYNALNGHGLYPHEGIAFRFGGFANDYLIKGQKWEPKAEIIHLKDDPKFNIDTMGWTVYDGRIGGKAIKGNTDGITGFPDKAWIKAIDNPDKTFYNPPSIIRKSNLYTSSTYILRVIIGYFIIYGLIKIVNNYLKEKSFSISLKVHIIVILIMLIISMSFRKVIEPILKKYV